MQLSRSLALSEFDPRTELTSTFLITLLSFRCLFHVAAAKN
jgi:hypothetical protein